jgi:hypothetical protein
MEMQMDIRTEQLWRLIRKRGTRNHIRLGMRRDVGKPRKSMDRRSGWVWSFGKTEIMGWLDFAGLGILRSVHPIYYIVVLRPMITKALFSKHFASSTIA